MMKLLVAMALLALGTFACSGALERVEPWQRGELASDSMRPDLNPLEAGNWGHVYFSKEASGDDQGAGGGGCGCN